MKSRRVKPHVKTAVQPRVEMQPKDTSAHPKGRGFTFKAVKADDIVKGGIMVKENSSIGAGNMISPERIQRKKRQRPKSFENFAPFVTTTRPQQVVDDGGKMISKGLDNVPTSLEVHGGDAVV